MTNKLRDLPSVDKLLSIVNGLPELNDINHNFKVDVIREVITNTRGQLIQGQDVSITTEMMAAQVLTAIRKKTTLALKPVVNGSGIVLHTNLGRAPLCERAKEAVSRVMTGYCNLEYNIETGERGRRETLVANKLCRLVKAESAIVVNNNAAAVLLVLSTLAAGKEVVVSRGELIEIGGSFRIPDVLVQSGAKLVEVGTTNKTHISDYENALTENTGVLLKVHTSNYRIIGFTSQPKITELSTLAKKYKLILIEDLGSGTLIPLEHSEWNEPTVAQRIQAGVDIVTFSGDKLLGAGQAGIIAGRSIYIDAIKKHPLMRALRVDKLTLAAFEGTLLEYEAGDPYSNIPVQQMLRRPNEHLRSTAQMLLKELEVLTEYGWQCCLVQVDSLSGGGALPGVMLSSWGISITAPDLAAVELEKLLRCREYPIIARIINDRVTIDMRCITEDELGIIAAACLNIAQGDSA